MEFWNDFSKAVAQAADNTVKETEKLTTIARLKYRVSTVNSKLDSFYKTLGEMKYSEIKGEKVTDEEYAKISEEITSLSKKLNAIEKRIAELSDYVNCPQCGYKIRRDVMLCPYCGLEIQENKEKTTEEKPIAEETAALPKEQNKED